MKKLYILLFCSSLLYSCEKKIDIDYPSTDPKYVIEGVVNESAIRTRITYSRDVMDNTQIETEANAIVTVSDNNGYSEILPYVGNGYYRSPDALGTPGHTYTIDVETGGKHYKAESTMPTAVSIGKVYYRKETIFTEEELFCCLKFEDVPNISNYYRYIMYVNEKERGWEVLSDNNQDGREILVVFSCAEVEESMGEEYKPEVMPGDKVRIELQSIDKFAYQYLLAIKAAGSSSPINPPEGYSEDCFGYFSAYGTSVYEDVYEKPEN